MFRIRVAAAVLALAAIPQSAIAEEPAPVTSAEAPTLTLERVFGSPSLNGPAPRLARLSPDGRWLTVLRNRPDDRERYDLWGYDRESGEWHMLVDSKKVGSGGELSEAEKMQRERARIGSLKGIVTYSWNADGQSLMVPLDGDLYLAGLDGSITRLTEGGVGPLNPELSPDGTYLSYVLDNGLHVGRLGEPARQITPDEGELVHWGEAEFVAQEEMDRRTGTWWSPDEKRIAVERYDEAPVGVVTRAAIGATGTRTFEQRYPAAGETNADVSLYLMDPDGGNRVRVDLGSDPDIYLARVDWAPDGNTLYVQRINRVQDRLDMLAVEPGTGSSRLLFSEIAAPGHWINLTDGYRFLQDGSLVWRSERDGFGHLWRFADGEWSQLTTGDWVVTKLVGVDEDAGRLFFTATRDDVTAPQVYALDYRAPGAPERLTDPAFTNDATMDKDGKTLLVTRSSDMQPPQVYLADERGNRLAWIEENALDADHPYSPYRAGHRKAEFGTLTGPDGSTLHWKMVMPEMEPGKRYPVFFSHYGGPHHQDVFRKWGGALVQAIVDNGYIWFEIDNRGSSNRGVEFEKQIFRSMGGVEVADQKAGATYLKNLPFVDPAKIAIFGWSYGGYMTLKQLEADPGFYAAGIAVAPVTRWELYDTFYTERYMGSPKIDAEAYATADALAESNRIADPLLLIHGMSDDNVVFENSSELIAKLQAENVPFEMMLYPGQTHSIGGPKISPHLYQTIFAFLERHGVTPPE